MTATETLNPTQEVAVIYSIRWTNADGSCSTWSGYRTAEEAEAVVAFAAARGGRPGTVEARTFEVR